jgi:hypothetical protein
MIVVKGCVPVMDDPILRLIGPGRDEAVGDAHDGDDGDKGRERDEFHSFPFLPACAFWISVW